MTDFCWIQDEFSSERIAPSYKASFVKLTRAEIAARSGLSLDEVVPALRKWVHSFTTSNYAVAWSTGTDPSDIVIIADTSVGVSRSMPSSRPRAQPVPS